MSLESQFIRRLLPHSSAVAAMWQSDIISSLQPSKVALTVIMCYIVNKAITSPTNMGTEDGDRLAGGQWQHCV